MTVRKQEEDLIMTLFSSTPVTERLTRINCPANVCALLAVGNDKAALIDTGFGYGDLKAYVETLTDKPVEVILTHGHYDHVGGAGVYEKAYIPKEDISLALAHSQKSVRIAGLAGFAITASEEELPPELKEEQLIGISDGWTLYLGGYTVKMLALHGHTQGMMCPLFVEDRVILFGDGLNSAAFLQMDHSLPIESYRDNLLIFKAKYEDLYDTPLYSHPHNFGGKEILDEMIALCAEITVPGYESVEMPEVLGPGIALAKPVDAGYRRIDGGTANMAYRKDNLYKPVRELSPSLLR